MSVMSDSGLSSASTVCARDLGRASDRFSFALETQEDFVDASDESSDDMPASQLAQPDMPGSQLASSSLRLKARPSDMHIGTVRHSQ